MMPARPVALVAAPQPPRSRRGGVGSDSFQRADGLRLPWHRRGRDRGVDPVGELARRLLDGTRGGQPGPVALVGAVEELGPYLCPPAARQAAWELMSGRPAAIALRRWQEKAPGSTERLVATALLVAARNGGSLVASIETAAALTHDAAAIEARRRALLAPARATTLVLVLLPVLFAAFASIISGAIIYRGPIGVLLLVTGLGLDLLGLMWMRRLQVRFGR